MEFFTYQHHRHFKENRIIKKNQPITVHSVLSERNETIKGKFRCHPRVSNPPPTAREAEAKATIATSATT